MGFIIRMAGRELRSSWRRVAFFFLCVAVGVAAIVALRSLIQNVRVALAAEARTLLAGDISIRTDRPWSDETRRIVDGRLAGVAPLRRTEIVDITTMVRVADAAGARTKVVELRGVRAEFPFYGRFRLADGGAYSFELLRGHGALVAPELLAQLGLGVGDDVLIGDVAFTIRGVILTEPGRRLGAFSFGPRVLVDHAALEETGVLGFASRATRQILLQVEAPVIDPLVAVLREDLQDEMARVRSSMV